jgi:hypothetical protein
MSDDDGSGFVSLRYVGGPVDNTTERRPVAMAPKVGSPSYRLSRGCYAKYVWDGSVFVFEKWVG